MAESKNLLEKLRQNRQRTTVPERDDALVKPEPQQQEPQREPSGEKIEPNESERNSNELKPDSADTTLEDLKAQLASFPETHRHSAIVLEKELDQELTRYCKDQGITVETFLEAAWQIASEDSVLLKQILEEAERRYKSRKEAGKLRRLITMLSKR